MTQKNLLDAMGRIDAKLITEAAPDTPYRENRNKTWVKWGAIAACFCLILAAFFMTIPHLLPDNNHGSNNHIAMLFTEAKVIEVYSSRSVLVEITAENIYDADTEKNLFAIGDLVRADFNEEIVLHFVPGDIVVIGRGDTASVDHSQTPYVAPCNSINIKAKEDYRSIRVGVENGEGAEQAGLAFVNRVYGEHFANLPEDNAYKIADYRLIRYTATEINDNSITGEFTFAIKTADVSLYAEQYPTSRTGELEGWIILQKRFILEYRNITYWHCIKLESMPVSEIE